MNTDQWLEALHIRITTPMGWWTQIQQVRDTTYTLFTTHWLHTVGMNTTIPTHFRLVRPQVAGPWVSVTILVSFLSKVTSHIAIDNGFAERHTLQEGKRMEGEGKEGWVRWKEGGGEERGGMVKTNRKQLTFWWRVDWSWLAAYRTLISWSIWFLTLTLVHPIPLLNAECTPFTCLHSNRPKSYFYGAHCVMATPCCAN